MTPLTKTALAASLSLTIAAASPSASAQTIEAPAGATPSPSPSRLVARRPARVAASISVGFVAGAAAALPGLFVSTLGIGFHGTSDAPGLILGGAALAAVASSFAVAGTVYGLGSALDGNGRFWSTYLGTSLGAVVGAGAFTGGLLLMWDGQAPGPGLALMALGSLMPAVGASIGYELSTHTEQAHGPSERAREALPARARVQWAPTLVVTREFGHAGIVGAF